MSAGIAIRHRDWGLYASAGTLLIIALAVTLGGSLAAWFGLDHETVNIFRRMEPPGPEHPLGTDELGRDLLARLIAGGRISLAIGFFGAIGSAFLGTAIGLLAGYAGGRTDSILMRFTDAILALPLLPLLIVLAAVDLGKLGLPESAQTSELVSVYKLIFLVVIFGWTTVARLVRASVLSLKTREFVLAARSLGASHASILLRHILPNAMTPIIIATTLSIGNIILTESVLSFLGLGIQPPLPSWGNMLTNAQETAWQAPQLAVYPGLLIFTTVVAFNFLGDGLQQLFEPRRTRR
jgi:peptide/nickel transport system permease protein